MVLDPTQGEKIYGSLIENIAFTNGAVGDVAEGTQGNGGATLLDNRSALLRNTTFRNNTSHGNGGAIYAINGLLTFEYCTFDTNISTNEEVGNGGALAYICDNPPLFPSPSLQINYSSFTKNICNKGSGGAVYVENY